jgi:integrase
VPLPREWRRPGWLRLPYSSVATANDHPRNAAIPGAASLQESRPRRQRARGALVHGLRHTYATEPANADVSVYTLMKLLGHESMTTSQRYVTGAGTENRAAAAQNPLYEMIQQPISKRST